MKMFLKVDAKSKPNIKLVPDFIIEIIHASTILAKTRHCSNIVFVLIYCILNKFFLIKKNIFKPNLLPIIYYMKY